MIERERLPDQYTEKKEGRYKEKARSDGERRKKDMFIKRDTKGNLMDRVLKKCMGKLT